MSKLFFKILLILFLPVLVQAQEPAIIKGKVTDAFTGDPLTGASITLPGTPAGTTTDNRGEFRISLSQPSTIIIGMLGYRADTLLITGTSKTISVRLTPLTRDLRETVITATLRETERSHSPVAVEVLGVKFLQKNPSPTLFESLGMVNGIQPQINCNVCNTGDIHINGMEGPYTLVLIDGMPIVSNLSSVYGLTGIPNALVKKIEIMKGPAGTLFGSEAVGGIINVITKDPVQGKSITADLSTTSYLEHNADVAASFGRNGNYSLLGISAYNYTRPADKNNDGFTDVTLQQRLSVFNKWTFAQKHAPPASFAVRGVYEDRSGGQLSFTPAMRGNDSIYGESIYTKRIEILARKPFSKNTVAELSYNTHEQDSWYGTTPFFALQHTAFAQLKRNIRTARSEWLLGLAAKALWYDDNSVITRKQTGPNAWLNLPDQQIQPGAFVQNEFSINEKQTLLSGIRIDHNNRHGFIPSPRLAWKINLTKHQLIRISGGNGFRVVNLFTEDHAALTGARTVVIKNALKPEQSWNGSLNYNGWFNTPFSWIETDVTVFYTRFTNKILPDYITDPNLVIYDNLKGTAVSQGIAFMTEQAFSGGIRLSNGATFMQVYTTDPVTQTNIPQLFAPNITLTNSAGYYWVKKEIKIDITSKTYGPMPLPVVPNDFRPDRSPWFTLLNLQVSKKIGNTFECYAGAKNILNFFPKDPILRPFDPFDKNVNDPVTNPYGYTFDPTYNYAPLQGIKAFAGLRISL